MRKGICVLFIILLFPLYGQDMEIEIFEDPEEEVEIFESTGEEEIDLFEEEGLELFADTKEEPELFDDSETLNPAQEEETAKNPVEILLENLSLKTESRYYYYFNRLQVPANAEPDPDKQQHMFEQHALYSTYASGDDWQAKIAFTSDIGNQDYTYKSRYRKIDSRSWEDWLQDADNERHYFDINECYLSFYFSRGNFIFGKKIFVNTLSTLYTPADNYTAQDLNDPLDGKKFGKYQIQGDLFLGNGTLSALFFPVYQGGKGVSPLSRWGYYKAKEKQDEEGITIEDPDSESSERNYEDITPGNFSYLLRYKTTAGGFDLQATLFYGLAGNTVSRDSDGGAGDEVEADVVPVFNTTAGFSTVKEKFEFHGEALYNYSIASRDDDYLRYVGGLRYTIDGFPDFFLMEKIELVGEYAGEWLIKRQSASDYEESSEEYRGLKSDILVLVAVDFSDKLKLNLFGQYELTDKGAAYSAHLEYRWLADLAVDLGGEFFYCPGSSNYYYWRDNHRIILKVTYDY